MTGPDPRRTPAGSGRNADDARDMIAGSLPDPLGPDAMGDETVRAELHSLLLDENQGMAATLAPRMLADPESLTPEVRWCLVYLLRGVRCLAARGRLLVPGTLLHTVAHAVEVARRATVGMDADWLDIARTLPGHWLGRYEDSEIAYSMEELRNLNRLLARLWGVERERVDLEDPPLLPRYLRDDAASTPDPARVVESAG